MKYRCCGHLLNSSMFFLGHVNRECVTFCCVPGHSPPRLAMAETPEETIANYVKLRTEIIAEGVKIGLLNESNISIDDRKYTKACHNCPLYHEMEVLPSDIGLVGHVTFGFYPSICQIKCIYCRRREDGDDYEPFSKELHEKGYDRVFATVEYAQKTGLIAPDATWAVSCGEITIHPYRDRIYEIVKGMPTAFYSNCCIFEPRIAENLGASQGSILSFSIDSGTPSTWHKIKGVNNFNKVLGNLMKYSQKAVNPQQIDLKYIVLPGLNDTLADYKGIVRIMKMLRQDRLVISRETYGVTPASRPDDPTSNLSYNERVIEAASRLMAMLLENGLHCHHVWGFSTEDRQKLHEATLGAYGN